MLEKAIFKIKEKKYSKFMLIFIKKNLISLLILFFILLVVNSFIFINKNFSKTQITTKIIFNGIEDRYEQLIYRNTFEKIKLNQSTFDEILNITNSNFFNSKKKEINFFTLGNSSYLLGENNINYENKTFVYKKFLETEYVQFFNDHFYKNLNISLIKLKKNEIELKKKFIEKCIFNESIEYKKNYLETFHKLIERLDVYLDELSTRYLPYDNLEIEYRYDGLNEEEKLDTIKDNDIVNRCLQQNYSVFFYLSNYDNLDLKNFKYDLRFSSYKNYKLIIFLNLITIMMFISVFFTFKGFFKFLKR
jgi:hypothetical protein